MAFIEFCYCEIVKNGIRVRQFCSLLCGEHQWPVVQLLSLRRIASAFFFCPFRNGSKVFDVMIIIITMRVMKSFGLDKGANGR